MDRLHRRAAEAIDRGAGDRERQIGQEADQARDVEALLALGEGAADDQVLDGFGICRGPVHERADHLRGKFVGSDFA